MTIYSISLNDLRIIMNRKGRFDIILNYMGFFFIYKNNSFKRVKLILKKKLFPNPLYCSYVIFISFHQRYTKLNTYVYVYTATVR